MKKLVSAAVLALPLFYGVEAAEVAPEVEEAVEEEHPAYEGVYFGFGPHVGAVGFALRDATGSNTGVLVGSEDRINDSKTRLGGSLVLGVGKKLPNNKFYGSFEVGLDFAPKITSIAVYQASATTRLYSHARLSRNGITPSLAIRLGAVDCNTKILTYLKGGISWAKITADYPPAAGDKPIDSKLTTATPFVGLGIEKAFAKKMTFRLEGDFKFGKNKTKDFDLYNGNISTKVSHRYETNIRALICYNVRIGA
ncbi:MAG: hypothetical protein LBF54_00020 [Holosporaceae bacterium]|nr:hypothetical protein [Holosporaceae bacterium]